MSQVTATRAQPGGQATTWSGWRGRLGGWRARAAGRARVLHRGAGPLSAEGRVWAKPAAREEVAGGRQPFPANPPHPPHQRVQGCAPVCDDVS